MKRMREDRIEDIDDDNNNKVFFNKSERQCALTLSHLHENLQEMKEGLDYMENLRGTLQKALQEIETLQEIKNTQKRRFKTILTSERLRYETILKNAEKELKESYDCELQEAKRKIDMLEEKLKIANANLKTAQDEKATFQGNLVKAVKGLLTDYMICERLFVPLSPFEEYFKTT